MSVAEGIPAWIDLTTPDIGAAQVFYEGLFGWEGLPAPGLAEYVVFLLGEAPIGGMIAQSDETRARGDRPVWTTYLAADDTAAAIARATAAGGRLIDDPFEAIGGLTVALLADPDGAAIATIEGLPQPAHPPGDRHGMRVRHELMSRDPEGVRPFYAALAGWETREGERDGGPYIRFTREGEQIAGQVPMDASFGETPAHWVITFAVDDCDAAAVRAEELGGTVCIPPTAVEGGRLAVIDDPHGATFAILQAA